MKAVLTTGAVDNEPTEVIRICPNGDIYVKGKLSNDDKEIVAAIRDFTKSMEKPVEAL